MTAPRAREHAGPPSPPDRRPPRRGGDSSPYIYAASTAGRPAGPARPPVARHGLVRSARALAATALLALTGALALPVAAEAQTSTTLVSNTGQGTPSDRRPAGLDSQRFTTGANASGYILTAVDVISGAEASATSTPFLAKVCGTDASGNPTAGCTALTVPVGYEDGDTLSLTASPGIELMNDTTYTLVLDNHVIESTAADGEDAAGESDWSIANVLRWSSDNGSTWNDHSMGHSLRIAIKGSAAVDMTPPTLESATVNAVGKIITLEFDEAVSQVGTGLPPTNAFSVTAGGNAVALQLASTGGVGVTDAIRLFVANSATIYTGQTVVVTYTDPSASDDTAAVQDTAGNDAASFTTGTSGVPAVTNNSTVVNPDTPTIDAVDITSSPVLETDTYGAGERIEVTVTFSEAVNATTDTDFVLSVGGDGTRAPLVRGSGTATLVFGYTVVPGDEDDNGIWIGDQDRTLVGNRDGDPQNGTITSVATSTAADLTHAELGQQSGHKVDGSRSIVSVAVSSTPMLETDTYGAGETIRFTVTFNVAVDVSGDPVLTFALGNQGQVRDVDAAHEGGGGSTALVFAYTVVSTDEDNNGIFLRDEDDFNNPDGPVRLDSDDTIRFAGTSTDVPLYWQGRGTQSGHKVDGSRTTGNNAPVFADASVTREVEENSAVGTSVGAVVTATDADNDTLTYSLEGTDAASFEIDSGTGRIKTVTGVTYNFEATKNSYSVTVKASDGTASATIAVTIDVTDVNEKSAKPDKPTLAAVTGSTTSLAATWTKPDLNGGPDIAGYDLQYREGTTGTWEDFAHTDTAATTTITGLTADTSYQVQVRAKNGETDSDWSDPSDAVKTNAEMTTTCALNPGDLWCGVVTVEELVFEGTSFAYGFVDASASPNPSDTGALSDKEFTVGTNRYTIDIATVGLGATAEGLNFSLTSALSDTDKEKLVLHVGSRTFAFSDATRTNDGFTYQWSNTGLDWSSETSVTLRLRGAPNNAPVFADELAAFTLLENSAADVVVGTVTATDADDDTLTYNLEGTDAGSFAIDSGTGEIKTKTGVTYDYEKMRDHEMTAKADDGNGGTDTIDVAITLLDDDTKSAKPDKPTLAPVPGSSTSLTATWTKPDLNGGTEIGGYDVAYRVGTTGTWELFEHVSSGLTTTITGLTADTSYQARVQAANHEAFSDWSDASDAVKTNAESGVDTAGVEGEFRLAPETVVDYVDPDNDRRGGTGPVEVYHAGAWGTVCRDGIRPTFKLDDNNELIVDSGGKPLLTNNGNEAAALICKAMNYDDGEYHMKYSKFLPGQAEADHQVADYWPPHSTYSGAATPIWLDDLRCVAGESALGTDPLPGAMSHCSYAGWGLHNCTHKEDAVVRCWNNDAAGPGLKSLQGRFVSPPERHDGTNRVKVRVAFSEPVEESPENVGAHGVEVEGGEVTSVSPVGGDAPDGAGTRKGSRSAGGRNAGEQDREVVWEFEIEPDSDGDLTVTLEAGRPCGEPGAICTADGRALSEEISTTVEGPEAPPPLTASFVGLPEAHDGESAFTFRVAFSENIGISYRSLREDAFAVSGGRVTRGERVDDRRDLFEMTVEPDGGGEVTVTLPAGRECGVSGAICTKGENRRQLTNAPTATVAGPAVESGAAGLTARFARVPSEHDGTTAFKLRIAFSETIRMSGRRLRSDVVAVSGGRATRAGRVNRRKDLWKLKVRPDSLADVTVTLSSGAACDSPEAVCTKGEPRRRLTNTISATVRGPVAVSVADARAREGEDETIDFAVSLSRAASGPVTVAYRTADGTATAGEDYTRASGKLKFAPGETAKTVRVPVLDDVVDEGEETFTLRLLNASGARIADGEATGTIVNSDPLQKMWLSRFGRTVAGQVVDAVTGRLSGPPGGSQVTLGGQGIDLSAPSAGDDVRRALGGRPGAANDDGPLAGRGAWEAARAGSWEDRQPGFGTERGMTGRELLLGSSFHLAAGGGEAGGPGYAAWGRMSVDGFDGEAPADGGTMRLDGEVTTGILGADAQWERWLAGLALSVSEGKGTFDHPRDSGTVESTLTSVSPYVRYEASDRLTAWGLLGYGTGDMTIRGNSPVRTDISMRLGAAGARGVLLEAGETGGVDLALRGDAFLVQMDWEKVSRETDTRADASRLRLLLEGGRSFALGPGAVLTPALELGLRHDGGDAETGTGVEVGGRIRYTDAGSGLTVEANARKLVAHEDSGYEEWGVSGSVRLDPGASGRGLSLRLAPVWGTPSSGVERLLSARDAAGVAPDGEFDAERRLEGELGYGFGAFGGRGVMTPWAGLGLAEAGDRTWRAGARWSLAPHLAISLDGARREPANDDAPEHGAQFRLILRW